MMYLKRIAVLSSLFAGAMTLSVHAQGLKQGEWQGRLMLPSGKVSELLMHVQAEGDSVQIELQMAESTNRVFDVRYEELSIFFSWDAGLPLECILHRQENTSLQGSCEDEYGGKGLLVLVPPEIAGSPQAAIIFEDWLAYWRGRTF